MNRNLLIVGAGTYAVVAFEIAMDMGCFEKIDFVDDKREKAPNDIEVVGTSRNIGELANMYGSIIVAIGDSKVRLSMLRRIEEETSYQIVTLVSPKAYISPSAQIMSGCIIEPMAVVHTGCVISSGCIISAGAVVNHASVCCDGVHVDCNATIEGYCIVPVGTKISSGEVYKRGGSVKSEELVLNPQSWVEYLNDISKRASGKIEDLKDPFEIKK